MARLGALVAGATHPGCAYRFLEDSTRAAVQAKTSRLVGAAAGRAGRLHACSGSGLPLARLRRRE